MNINIYVAYICVYVYIHILVAATRLPFSNFFCGKQSSNAQTPVSACELDYDPRGNISQGVKGGMTGSEEKL